jgi:hypothetical protein
MSRCSIACWSSIITYAMSSRSVKALSIWSGDDRDRLPVWPGRARHDTWVPATATLAGVRKRVDAMSAFLPTTAAS